MMRKILSNIYMTEKRILTLTNSSVTSPETCVSNNFFSKADNRSIIKYQWIRFKMFNINFKNCTLLKVNCIRN